MKKWVNLWEYGVWNIEKILITFDVPLLFVCLTPQRLRYLVLCINEETGEYLASKTNKRLLLNMLRNKCTMRRLFTDGVIRKCLYISYDFEQSVFHVQEKNCSELPEEWLPDEGAVLGLCNESVLSYTAKLENETVHRKKYYRQDRMAGKNQKINMVHKALLSKQSNWFSVKDGLLINERR